MQNHIFGNKILCVLFSFLALFFLQPSFVIGAVKDTDFDGLSDGAETDTYFTDPSNPDTDGDSIPDGQEILDLTDPLDKESSLLLQLKQERSENKINEESLPWHIGRASGILAFVLLSVVVINGLLMTTRIVFKLLPPALNYEMHHFLSWMGLFAVIGHAVSFMFDPFFHLTLSEALVPLKLHRDFSSGLGYDLGTALGLGIIAFYGLLTLIITSELRGRYIPQKVWQTIHYISFVTYLLFLGHGYLAGTDSGTWWMQWIYALSASIVSFLTLLRISIAVKKKKGDTSFCLKHYSYIDKGCFSR